MVPIPGEAALLPFEAAWLLVAAWVGFAGTIVWTMARGRASFARVLHVGLHATAIAVTMLVSSFALILVINAVQWWNRSRQGLV